MDQWVGCSPFGLGLVCAGGEGGGLGGLREVSADSSRGPCLVFARTFHALLPGSFLWTARGFHVQTLLPVIPIEELGSVDTYPVV